MSEQNANQQDTVTFKCEALQERWTFAPGAVIFKLDPSHTEILRFDPDGGFSVRGQRVPIDQEEGLRVYAAFVDWMKSVGMFK